MVKITMIDFFRDKFLKNSQKSNANKSCAFSQNKNDDKQIICSCCGFVFYDKGNCWLEKRKENFSQRIIENKTDDILAIRLSKITKDIKSKSMEYSDESEMVELDLFNLDKTFKCISKVVSGRAEIYLLECNRRKESKNYLELSDNRLICIDSSELKKNFEYFSALANNGASVYLIKAYKRQSKAFEFMNKARKKIVSSFKKARA